MDRLAGQQFRRGFQIEPGAGRVQQAHGDGAAGAQAAAAGHFAHHSDFQPGVQPVAFQYSAGVFVPQVAGRRDEFHAGIRQVDVVVNARRYADVKMLAQRGADGQTAVGAEKIREIRPAARQTDAVGRARDNHFAVSDCANTSTAACSRASCASSAWP